MVQPSGLYQWLVYFKKNHILVSIHLESLYNVYVHQFLWCHNFREFLRCNHFCDFVHIAKNDPFQRMHHYIYQCTSVSLYCPSVNGKLLALLCSSFILLIIVEVYYGKLHILCIYWELLQATGPGLLKDSPYSIS